MSVRGFGRRLGRWLGRCLIAGAAVWALTFAALVAYVAYPVVPPAPPERGDAIICLGAGMSRTRGWEVADSASIRRAMTCAMLYAEGVAPIVLFTGYGHEVGSAASAMARVAMDLGVPAEAIVLEEQARSTLQNAAFSAALLPEGTRRVIVVTDRFHLPRSAVIYRSLLDMDVVMVATDPRSMAAVGRDGRSTLGWMLRETLAIWSNLARGGAYLLGGIAGIDPDTRIAWFN